MYIIFFTRYILHIYNGWKQHDPIRVLRWAGARHEPMSQYISSERIWLIKFVICMWRMQCEPKWRFGSPKSLGLNKWIEEKTPRPVVHFAALFNICRTSWASRWCHYIFNGPLGLWNMGDLHFGCVFFFSNICTHALSVMIYMTTLPSMPLYVFQISTYKSSCGF